MDKKLNELVYILLTLEEQGLSESVCSIRYYDGNDIFMFNNNGEEEKLESIFGGKFKKRVKAQGQDAYFYRMKCGEFFSIEVLK